MFVRHGEAEHNVHIHDSERSLTAEGLKHAKTLALFLKHLSIRPDLILTSPLVRAQQTAQELSSVLQVPTETTEYLVNGTHPRQLFQLMNEKNIPSLLLVGHQPFLSELISLLIADSTEADIEMKPCSIAVVDIPRPVKEGKGTLLWLCPISIIEHTVVAL